MSTTYTMYAKDSAYIRANAKNENDHSSSVVDLVNGYLLVSFNAPPSSYFYKEIEGVTLAVDAYCYSSVYSTASTSIWSRCLKKNYDPNTVTYNSIMDNRDDYWDLDVFQNTKINSTSGEVYFSFSSAMYNSEKLLQFLKNGALLGTVWTSYNSYVYTSENGTGLKPYITVTFSNNNVHGTVEDCSPSSGFINEKTANTFSWRVGTNASCYGTITQTGAVFRWKTSSSGAVTEVNCGTTNSVTIPANTFSTDTIMWQVAVTDSGGTTTTSAWYTLSTVEETSSAVAVYPKNTAIDGSKVNRFSWDHIIATGTKQTKAELQYSTNASSWTTFMTPTGSDTFVEVPANTFSSGSLYWRVRTANTDDQYGSYSDAVPFTVISAPSIQGVTATVGPHPIVSWQSADQQGYQIVVEGVFDSGTKYGTESSYQLPIYLSDGSYTIKARVQNVYGLWSEYGLTSSNVRNTESGSINLIVEGSGYSFLSWETVTSFNRFAVYRDGFCIAVTTEKSYTDFYSIGRTVYYVRGLYTSNFVDYYTESNRETVNVLPEILTIYADNMNPLALKYSDSQTRTISNTLSTSFSMYNVFGAEYPIVESSGHKSKSISFRAAFMFADDAAELEAFFGKTVCIKTSTGDMVRGILGSLSRTENEFYIGYTATVSNAHYSEVVEL